MIQMIRQMIIKNNLMDEGTINPLTNKSISEEDYYIIVSNKNGKYKLWYFIKGFVQFLWVLPSYDLVHIHTSEPPSALRKCLFISFAKIILGNKNNTKVNITFFILNTFLFSP